MALPPLIRQEMLAQDQLEEWSAEMMAVAPISRWIDNLNELFEVWHDDFGVRFTDESYDELLEWMAGRQQAAWAALRDKDPADRPSQTHLVELNLASLEVSDPATGRSISHEELWALADDAQRAQQNTSASPPARASEPETPDEADELLATGDAPRSEFDSLTGQSLAMAPSDADEKNSDSNLAASDDAEDVGPPGETFWEQMIDWRGWWAFLTNRRRVQTKSGRWRFTEPVWDPGEAFRRDAAAIPLNPVPYEAIGALMSGDLETALKEAAIEIAVGKIFKYGGKLYEKLPGGRFRSLGAAAEGGSERTAREVSEDVAQQARRRGTRAAASRGPTIRNAHLAGKKHPVSGIPFDKDGYPDFSKVATKRVPIKQTGKRKIDSAAANKAAGLEETPNDFVWHHHQDGTTMELVPEKIHRQTGHTGGVARLKQGETPDHND